MTRVPQGALAGLAAAALIAPAAFAHPERPTFFPDGSHGAVPKYRTEGGQRLVVCKRDSAKRIRRTFTGKRERKRLRLVRKCRFRHIQQAVDAARNNARIQILPGVYREPASRCAPEPDPRCADDYDEIGMGADPARVANYEYQRKCPNAQNLIAIVGDSTDADRVCDVKCNIQIEGMGRRRSDVLISGQRSKLNVVRADRADGIYLRNFTIQFSDFNNIYILETNGFAMKNIVSRYSREYGFLSFTSDHGLRGTGDQLAESLGGDISRLRRTDRRDRRSASSHLIGAAVS